MTLKFKQQECINLHSSGNWYSQPGGFGPLLMTVSMARLPLVTCPFLMPRAWAGKKYPSGAGTLRVSSTSPYHSGVSPYTPSGMVMNWIQKCWSQVELSVSFVISCSWTRRLVTVLLPGCIPCGRKECRLGPERQAKKPSASKDIQAAWRVQWAYVSPVLSATDNLRWSSVACGGE